MSLYAPSDRPTVWTAKRVERLKKLWAEGHFASEIAEMLGNATRNSVLGKIHRLGLNNRNPNKSHHIPHPNYPRHIDTERK